MSNNSSAPTDLHAYDALRDTSLAADIYTWITHRMNYTELDGKLILWDSRVKQFGSSFIASTAAGDFRKSFLKAFLEINETGIVLLPRQH